MQVTAVITTYKREPEMVERALQSIINQTHRDIQIIVVDDSPSDYPYRNAIAEMVSKYPGALYIPHEKNSGACVARNTGLANATGEFIGFLDDDDEWLPEKIEKQLEGFTDDSIGLVYSSSLVHNYRTGKTTQSKPKIVRSNFYEELFNINYVGSTSFPLIRTEALKAVGGFDPIMPAAQDYDTWLRIAEKYNFGYIDLPLIKYHVHDGEQITKNPDRKIFAINRIIEKHRCFLDSHPKSLASLHLYLVEVCAIKSDSKAMFKHWWTAVKLDPFNFKGNFVGLGRLIKSLLGMYKTK